MSEDNISNPSIVSSDKPRVGLFVTCLVDLYRPSVGFAAVKLLQEAGCVVEVPVVQTCCGQPALNNGDYASSRELAQQVIAAFEGYDYTVGASGSCMGTIRNHYAELFRDDPEWYERAEQLAARSHELTGFLVDIMGVKTVASSYQGHVTYHDSCSSLREMNVKQQPRQLLESVTGLEVHEMDNCDVCCGFGGTFCIKYPDISTRMVDDKVNAIDKTGADTLLAGDMGCLLNICGRLKRLGKDVRVYHVAEVLADMTDVPGLGDKD